MTAAYASAKTCGFGVNSDHYAYAAQYTSVSPGSGTCFDAPGYFGWAGVDGQITTPSTFPTRVNNADHNLGFLEAKFTSYGTTESWIQIGWLFGVVGANCQVGSPACVSSTNQYSLYVESLDPFGYYTINKLSPLSLGTSITYRVQYSSDGCWHAYYNYNTPVSGSWCNYPTSAAVDATNEVYSSTNYVAMPLSDFGSSAPNTNQTLRLLGSGGWRDWTSSVVTTVVQNRPYFYWSPFVSGQYHHFLTYGSVT
jgi:hypothetical protein